jgi:nucleoside phosphorylase
MKEDMMDLKFETVVLAAMDSEAEQVRKQLRKVECKEIFSRKIETGFFGERQFALIVTGIGKVEAAAAAEFAICVLGAKRIVNAGLCGGFGEDVKMCAVYEVSEAAEYDFDLSAFNGGFVGVKDGESSAFAECFTAGRYPAKKLATGDRFSDDESDHGFIFNVLGCELRDMEGAAIAFVCRKHSVRCEMYKCVTDIDGCGAMTKQFLDNKAAALDVLGRAIFSALDSQS